jgi:hypothetical protein
MPRLSPHVLVLVLWLGATACASRHVPVGRTPTAPVPACFDTAALSPAERELNEALLLKALDSEALYTILADIKPMSSGFERQDISVEAPDGTTVEATRRVLATWQCGADLAAGLQAFARVHDGKRTLHAWVARRSAVRALITRQSTFFAALGVTPTMPAGETLLTIEHALPAVRFRGSGWLFGYPDDAVTFFVDAALSQERTGQFVVRDFRSVPTFGNPTNQFVWARPKGAVDSPEELAIEGRAREVLADYRARRARFIGPGRPGAVALVREALGKGPADSAGAGAPGAR